MPPDWFQSYGGVGGGAGYRKQLLRKKERQKIYIFQYISNKIQLYTVYLYLGGKKTEKT